ncbi:MAG: hypothetical protein QXL94_01675 [Candidatus Parvarchaeum sp.]
MKMINLKKSKSLGEIFKGNFIFEIANDGKSLWINDGKEKIIRVYGEIREGGIAFLKLTLVNGDEYYVPYKKIVECNSISNLLSNAYKIALGNPYGITRFELFCSDCLKSDGLIAVKTERVKEDVEILHNDTGENVVEYHELEPDDLTDESDFYKAYLCNYCEAMLFAGKYGELEAIVFLLFAEFMERVS